MAARRRAGREGHAARRRRCGALHREPLRQTCRSRQKPQRVRAAPRVLPATADGPSAAPGEGQKLSPAERPGRRQG